VQDVIMTAIGGMNITYTVEGLERYPVNVRYKPELRDDPDKLGRVLVPTPRGEHIPLSQLASLGIRKGPPAIKSENARLNAWVQVSIREDEVDLGTYVARAQKAVEERVDLPPGYSIKWSGRYEYMDRAQKRLALVLPVTLLIIFFLLYIHFRNLTEVMIVLLTIPFSLVGGVWLMFALGYNMSVAVAVGFIALAGLAAETGIVMLAYLDEVHDRRKHGSLRRDHRGGRAPGPTQADDRGDDDHRASADHDRQRLRARVADHAANRRPDGRRSAQRHGADAPDHPGNLHGLEGLAAQARDPDCFSGRSRSLMGWRRPGTRQ
jgi:Cu(I)/Ag(I) efflux system membrane protein CusA/SilA